MSNKFLPLDIEHRSNGKLANPQNPKMLACENECDTICVCRLLSLGNLCRRWQTVSPPLHFTSHELVNIIQRHLFSLNVFPSSFLLFLFFLFKIFFFVGFVVRYWMMMTWCFGATSLLTWPLSVKHQTCAKLSDVHSTYRLTSVFSNHTMAGSMIFIFFFTIKK